MKVLSIIAIAGLASAASADALYSNHTAGQLPQTGTLTSGTFDVNLSDVESWDAQGSANNVVMLVDVNAALGGVGAASMTGIGWDVTISTVGASWLSEAGAYFDDNIAPDGLGLFLSPGAGNDAPGTASFSSGGIIDLSDNNIADIALADGILRIEFIEGFDDVPGAIDAFMSGTFTIAADYNAVPAPAGLAILGLGGLVATRRRR